MAWISAEDEVELSNVESLGVFWPASTYLREKGVPIPNELYPLVQSEHLGKTYEGVVLDEDTHGFPAGSWRQYRTCKTVQKMESSRFFFCPVLLMSVVEEIACEVKTKEQEHDQKGRTDNR